MTSAGCQTPHLDGLPRDVGGLAGVVQGLLMHRHVSPAYGVEVSEARLAELPADAEVVAYCRGPYCVYAHEAVRRLRAAGRRARRLEDGWPEWRLAGLPHEIESPDGAPPKETTA